jgi:Flp pilus assembly protein TadD
VSRTTRRARAAGAGQAGPGWARLALVAAVAVTYGQACGFGFVSLDDWNNIVDNPYVSQPSAAGVAALWRQGYEALYIPVTYTFWALQAALFRGGATAQGPAPLWPQCFHAVNLVLHALNTLLVFELLRTLLALFAGGEGSRGPGARVSCGGTGMAAGPGAGEAAEPSGWPAWWPAAAGAGLFALHPVQVEPVVWATGAKDLLSGLLSLAALRWSLAWAALSRGRDPSASGRAPRPGGPGAEASDASPAGRRARGQTGRSGLQWRLEPGTRLFLLATASYSLALLAKPSAVAVPLVALAAVWLGAGSAPLAAVRMWGGWAVLALPVVACNKALQGNEILTFVTPVAQRPWVALDALGFYLVKLAVPWQLGADYGRSPQMVLGAGELAFVFVAVGGMVLAAILAWRHRSAAVAVVLFGAPILPVLGLVPFGFQDYSTVADRYLYLAMMGPALAVACLVKARDGHWLRTAWLVALVALAARSSVQVGAWKDSQSLFSHGLAVNPRSHWLKNGLAHSLMQENRDAEAVAVFEEALALRPGYDDARVNLGVAYGKLGRFESAVEQFRAVLSRNPGDTAARQNLGMALARGGQLEEGIREFRETLRRRPNLAGCHDELGIALARSGDLRGAARHFAEALRFEPDRASARAHLEKALRQLEAAGLDPNGP